MVTITTITKKTATTTLKKRVAGIQTYLAVLSKKACFAFASVATL